MRRMVLALLLSSYLPSADASMVIDGTRIIFSGDKKEIAVRATNMGETPSLTQVWVDDGRVQNQPEKDAAPFIVLPPIVRIEPGKGQSWRLVFNGSRRIGNRCSGSIFWISHLSRKMARLTITCSSRYGRVSSCFTVRQAWRRKK